MSKTALIIGITGQDGRLLSEYLNTLNYKIYGVASGQNSLKREWIKEKPYINLIEGDLRDLSSLIKALEISNPDEVYNLGAISSVKISWKQPELVSEVTGLGALRMLEAIKIFLHGDMSKIKYFQASSSEIFGNSKDVPQNEDSKIMPISPYGIAKTFAHNTTVNYREAYGAFACNGILYNHSSQYRGDEFITKKITNAVVRIKQGRQLLLELGNINHLGDWGYAGDYVEAMHAMLQNDKPVDYIISSGKRHSIQDMVTTSFSLVGIDNWVDYLIHTPENRPTTTGLLYGDNSKIFNDLGWSPKKSMSDWLKIMIDCELKNV
jgi:GDPmannose 4,6-dehydratase